MPPSHLTDSGDGEENYEPSEIEAEHASQTPRPTTGRVPEIEDCSGAWASEINC
jgi:hypothetical protein